MGGSRPRLSIQAVEKHLLRLKRDNPALRDHITRVGQVLYEREDRAT